MTPRVSKTNVSWRNKTKTGIFLNLAYRSHTSKSTLVHFYSNFVMFNALPQLYKQKPVPDITFPALCIP